MSLYKESDFKSWSVWRIEGYNVVLQAPNFGIFKSVEHYFRNIKCTAR